MRWFLALFCVLAQAAVNQTSQQMNDTVRQAILAEWDPKVRVEVEKIYTRGAVPEDATITGFYPNPPIGVSTFEWVWDAGGTQKRTTGNALVKAYARIAIAKTNLRHGETISEDNVQFEEKELGKILQTGYFTDPESVRGLVVKGYVRAGSPINLLNSEAPQAVQRGQSVDLIHGSNSVTIVARVKALDSGRVGDWIRVENPTSKRVIRARVTGSGETHLK